MPTKTRSKPSSTRRSEPDDPATKYARDVVAGRIVVGDLARRACRRHLSDLKSAGRRGYVWRPDLAGLIYKFCSLLTHSKGRWAGKPIDLEPWEYFLLGSVWGWRRKDGTRRFRHIHLEVARKNGKTFLAAVLALALLVLDGEAGAEVYCVATKLDQARITHEDAKRMVKASDALSQRLELFKSAIAFPAANGTLQPLGRESGSLDGLNVHGAIADELHAWRDELLWDVIQTATGARDQPLIVRTTTAGYDKQTLWFDLRKSAVAMLQGKRQDDRLFALIYTLDDGDDWKDEKVYAKANPNLGVTVRLEDLVAERDEAIAVPGRQGAFRRLKLNQLTEAVSTWLPVERWDACGGIITPEMLAGRRCLIGIDMSSSRDLTAGVKLYPPAANGDLWILVPHFWLPEEGIDQKSDEDGQPYRQWAEDGYLTLIPGPVIDPDYVEEWIEQQNAETPVSTIVFDRRFAMKLSANLQGKGYACVGFGQGFFSMKDPVIEFERNVVGRQFLHNGCPVLRSCVMNVAIEQDAAGCRKPSKKKSTGRIDGVIAALMPLGVAMDTQQLGDPEIHFL
jgi:phage terminase large subunit-like protein